MGEMTEQNYKKTSLKIKTQEKELQAVKALINRSSGYAKTQAEASETRLTEEIATLKKEFAAMPVPKKATAKPKAAKVIAAKKVKKTVAKPAAKSPAKKKKTK